MSAVAERRSVPLIVRVQPDLADRVREAAAAEHRTISSFGLVALAEAADRTLTNVHIAERLRLGEQIDPGFAERLRADAERAEQDLAERLSEATP